MEQTLWPAHVLIVLSPANEVPAERMHPTTELDLAYAFSLMEEVSFLDREPVESRVLIFRTSVRDDRSARRLRPLLERLVGATGRWTIDLEDRDHVLRIESSTASHTAVITALREAGEDCSELD